MQTKNVGLTFQIIMSIEVRHLINKLMMTIQLFLATKVGLVTQDTVFLTI